MISDILSQVTIDLDHYLTDPNFDSTYGGELRERIIRFREEADYLRATLDALSGETPPPNDHQHQTKSARSKWIDWMMSEESAVTPPFFTQKDLFERGWSKCLIDRVLGGPHWTATNPHGAGFAPMRCWRQDRVLDAEQTTVFRERS